MLRIALVDDEQEFLEQMKGLLLDWFEGREEFCHIDTFRKAELFYMESTEGKAYDICFLDINMPRMDGRELAMKIREQDEDVYIVFVTSHSRFVKVGYQVGAFDFIVKEEAGRELPGLMERLLRAYHRHAKEFYTISTYCRYEKIAYRNIIFIYKQGQNAMFVLKDREVQERKALKKVLEDLGGEDFVLVERGYIVNLSHIVRINARELLLSNGMNLTVSKEHIKNVRERLGMYCMYKLSGQ